ncbi:MAG: anthranilate phosphoribosyltransferase [Sphingopyxis sp.]
MTADESETLFGQMLDGEMADAQITALLIAMADRGETSAEIAGAARAMRARMIRITAPTSAIDVCGTGGDGQHSLNVSTAVAIVVAVCEIPVAKHGNRAASSLVGGADTLEALGLNLDRASETAEATLADLGICFLFAQRHHPALARLSPIRKSIGRRTIFNLLGPLCNPAGVRLQLIGVAAPALLPVYAGAMHMLGTERAMIVSGKEGLDELSVSGPSEIATIGFGLPSHIVTPEDAGLSRHAPEALHGGDAAYNAAALKRLLMGKRETAQDRAYRDAVLLNAAAALIVAGHAEDWREGVEEATEAIDKGLAKALLDCWVGY